MKKPFLLLLLVSSMFSAIAQKPAVWYNHTMLIVHNMDTSLTFYTNVFQADTIPCPFTSDTVSRTKWLKVGEGVELHLVQMFADTAKSANLLQPGQLGVGHMGFMVSSMDAFLKKLAESTDFRTGKYKIPATLRTMPYGAKTIQIPDPDGNWIHIIEAMPLRQ